MDNFTKWAMVGIALMAAGIFMTAEAAYTPSSSVATWDAVSNTSWVTIQGGANWLIIRDSGDFLDGAYLRSNNAAQNNEVGWVFYSDTAAQKTFGMRYYKGSGVGIATILVNDVSQGTIDGYDSSTIKNNTATVTITTQAGMNSLRIAIRTKNGASSGFDYYIQDWYIK